MAVGVAILGCTGSIGRSALSVIERHPDRFRVVALAAHRSADELAAAARRHNGAVAVLADGGYANGDGSVRGGRSSRSIE